MEKNEDSNIIVIAGGQQTNYIASIVYKGIKHNTVRLHMRQAYLPTGEFLAKLFYSHGWVKESQMETKDINKTRCICGHSDVEHKEGKKCAGCACKKFVPQSIDVIEIVLEKIPALKLH